MTRESKAVFDTDRKHLATLLDLAPDAEQLWRDEELGAILRHQFTAPLQLDLINMEQGLAVKVRNLAESQGLTPFRGAAALSTLIASTGERT